MSTPEVSLVTQTSEVVLSEEVNTNRETSRHYLRDMNETLRKIEDAQRPKAFGNLKMRGKLMDGFAMLHGVDPADFTDDETDGYAGREGE